MMLQNPITKRSLFWKLGGCLLLLCLISLHACKLNLSSDTPLPDPEPTLPPATQTGANTFGCMLNGEVWVHGKTRCTGPTGIFPTSFYYNGGLSVGGCRKNSEYSTQNFLFDIPDFEGVGNYGISNNITIIFNDSRTECDYYNLFPIEGQIVITKFDAISRIVSGTFEFTIVHETCDTLRFQDGRFDINYN